MSAFRSFKMPREFYIPKHSQKVCDKLSDAVAYLSTNSKGKPRATVFFAEQAKPVADYWYRDGAPIPVHDRIETTDMGG